MKMAEKLIEESKHKKTKKQLKLKATIQQNADNFGNAMLSFALMFQAIQQPIAEQTKQKTCRNQSSINSKQNHEVHTSSKNKR